MSEIASKYNQLLLRAALSFAVGAQFLSAAVS